jgi:hypothetical protein
MKTFEDAVVDLGRVLEKHTRALDRLNKEISKEDDATMCIEEFEEELYEPEATRRPRSSYVIRIADRLSREVLDHG